MRVQLDKYMWVCYYICTFSHLNHKEVIMNVQAQIFFSNCAPAPSNTLHHFLASKCDRFEKAKKDSRFGTIDKEALDMAKEVNHYMKKCWTFSLATGVPMTFFYFDEVGSDNKLSMIKKSLSVKDSDFSEEEEIFYVSSGYEAQAIIVDHYDENPKDFFTANLTELLTSI